MKKWITASVATGSLLLVFAGNIFAAGISINFCVGSNDVTLVDAGEAATQFYSVSGTNWNNVLLANSVNSAGVFVTNTTSGHFIQLQDDLGHADAARLTSSFPVGGGNSKTSGVTTVAASAAAEGEAGIMASYLLLGGNYSSETFTVSGLVDTFTRNGYKVYLFFDIGTVLPSTSRTNGYSVYDGTVSNTFWTVDSAGDNSDINDDGVMEWVRATGGNSADATVGANYALFEGLSGSNFTVSVAGAYRGSICGLQIVANERPVVDVYLLGGQSNMQGKGDVSAIPEGEEVVPGVLYYHASVVKGATLPNVLYTNVTPTGAAVGWVGPEIGFAGRMKQLRPDATMALIKYAVSGTDLAVDWCPGSNALDAVHWGTKFSGFVNTVTSGLVALAEAGYEPRIAGMLWQQGEADANVTSYANLYESNLVHFIARVREQFAADISPEGMRFVQGTILPYRPPSGYAGRDTVNTAKLDMDENSGIPSSVPNTSTVYCDEIITPTRAQILNDGDAIHLATEGQLMLGKLMAERMQVLDFSGWSDVKGLVAGPAGDDDDDGLSNGLEFFLGTDPKSAGSAVSAPAPSQAFFDAGAGLKNYFVISFRQSMLHRADDFSWQVDGATNLSSWGVSSFAPVLVDRINHNDGTATFRYRAARPIDEDTQGFLRLRITFQTP